ncbi:MAG: nitroreductase family deazaflavin-dependent oxidoreductase [Anaerolineaceae bacterium]|nr:nitroreductase family deazaflavin-dependent oxidoreductase [Anaerolineaceae bacterium]
MNDFNARIIKEFRANEGVVGGPFEGATLLLLHTTGAKSGKERVNPLMYFKEGDRYVIIASKAGADSHPDWYYNVKANPDVSIEVGTEQLDAQASIAPEPDRTQLYEKMESISSAFTEYKNKASRVIPVVTLTPTSS